jgi:hypothetical protein
VSITELIGAYLNFAERCYRCPTDGRPGSEYSASCQAAKVLNRLFGSERANQFGPIKLKAVRMAMASGSWVDPECDSEPGVVH